jgi:hypothetical protein
LLDILLNAMSYCLTLFLYSFVAAEEAREKGIVQARVWSMVKPEFEVHAKNADDPGIEWVIRLIAQLAPLLHNRGWSGRRERMGIGNRSLYATMLQELPKPDLRRSLGTRMVAALLRTMVHRAIVAAEAAPTARQLYGEFNAYILSDAEKKAVERLDENAQATRATLERALRVAVFDAELRDCKEEGKLVHALVRALPRCSAVGMNEAFVELCERTIQARVRRRTIEWWSHIPVAQLTTSSTPGVGAPAATTAAAKGGGGPKNAKAASWASTGAGTAFDEMLEMMPEDEEDEDEYEDGFDDDSDDDEDGTSLAKLSANWSDNGANGWFEVLSIYPLPFLEATGVALRQLAKQVMARNKVLAQEQAASATVEAAKKAAAKAKAPGSEQSTYLPVPSERALCRRMLFTCRIVATSLAAGYTTAEGTCFWRLTPDGRGWEDFADFQAIALSVQGNVGTGCNAAKLPHATEADEWLYKLALSQLCLNDLELHRTKGREISDAVVAQKRSMVRRLSSLGLGDCLAPPRKASIAQQFDMAKKDAYSQKLKKIAKTSAKTSLKESAKASLKESHKDGKKKGGFAAARAKKLQEINTVSEEKPSASGQAVEAWVKPVPGSVAAAKKEAQDSHHIDHPVHPHHHIMRHILHQEEEEERKEERIRHAMRRQRKEREREKYRRRISNTKQSDSGMRSRSGSKNFANFEETVVVQPRVHKQLLQRGE